jgi:hypothetical protein
MVVLGIEERRAGAAVVGVVGIALAALLAGNGRVVSRSGSREVSRLMVWLPALGDSTTPPRR